MDLLTDTINGSGCGTSCTADVLVRFWGVANVCY